MKFRLMFVILPCLFTGVWAAPLPIHVVVPERIFPQLDALLKQAVGQSPRMLSHVLDLEIAENDRAQARAGLLPNFGASYSFTQAKDDRADLTSGRIDVTKVYYNVALTQPLFHWGERRNNDKIGEIKLKLASGEFHESYRLLAQEIRAQYLYLIGKKAALERAKLNRSYQQGVLKTAEDRLAAKAMSDADIFPIRLNEEQAQVDLERIAFEYESSLRSLARICGVESLDESAVPADIPALASSKGEFEQLLAEFLSQTDLPTREALILRRQIEIDELSYKIEKTRLLPKINFVIGANQDEQSYSINAAAKYRVNSLYAGVQGSWTIFDGFLSRAATRNALIRRRQNENNYRELTEELSERAQTQVKLVDFSERNVRLHEKLVGSARGSLKTRELDFKRGVASEVDVTASRLGLHDINLRLINARVEYLLSVTKALETLSKDPVAANLSNK
jgi:outer membrane protein TolC